MSNKRTQTTLILGHLMTGKGITPLDALRKYGCFRLADVIYRLRNLGINIHGDMVAQPPSMKGKKFSKYYLDDSELIAIQQGKIYTPEDYIELMREKSIEKAY